ncbi:TPA: integrase core domain-containing protein [Klebsiella pneumoniae]
MNKDWYMSLEVAWCRIEAWRIHYNQRRPYYALVYGFVG